MEIRKQTSGVDERPASQLLEDRREEWKIKNVWWIKSNRKPDRTSGGPSLVAGVRGRVVGVIGEGEERAIDGQGEKKNYRGALASLKMLLSLIRAWSCKTGPGHLFLFPRAPLFSLFSFPLLGSFFVVVTSPTLNLPREKEDAVWFLARGKQTARDTTKEKGPEATPKKLAAVHLSKEQFLLTLHSSGVAKVSTLESLSSVLPTCNRKYFQWSKKLHWVS